MAQSYKTSKKGPERFRCVDCNEEVKLMTFYTETGKCHGTFAFCTNNHRNKDKIGSDGRYIRKKRK